MARKTNSSGNCRARGPCAVVRYEPQPERIIAPGATSPVDGIILDPGALVPLNCVYRDDAHGIWLYQGDCLEVLDAIAAKHQEGCFDMIFADPPYFLSNGGITCHAGKMVKVDKGDWDKSKGAEENHIFNTEWLRRCQRVLKPNGTIWVTGTHHVIFSVGYAMQQLGYKPSPTRRADEVFGANSQQHRDSRRALIAASTTSRRLRPPLRPSASPTRPKPSSGPPGTTRASTSSITR